MTPRAFEDLLDRYGGDMTRWPDEARGHAETLLQMSHACRNALSALQEAERLLAALRVDGSVSSATLAARAMRRTPLQPRRPTAFRIGWAAAAAAALAVGILIGGINGGGSRDDDTTIALVTALGPSEAADVD